MPITVSIITGIFFVQIGNSNVTCDEHRFNPNTFHYFKNFFHRIRRKHVSSSRVHTNPVVTRERRGTFRRDVTRYGTTQQTVDDSGKYCAIMIMC